MHDHAKPVPALEPSQFVLIVPSVPHHPVTGAFLTFSSQLKYLLFLLNEAFSKASHHPILLYPITQFPLLHCPLHIGNHLVL